MEGQMEEIDLLNSLLNEPQPPHPEDPLQEPQASTPEDLSSSDQASLAEPSMPVPAETAVQVHRMMNPVISAANCQWTACPH